MTSGIFTDKTKYILLFVILISGIILYLPSLSIEYVADEISFINRNKVSDLQELTGLFDKKDYDGDYYRPIGNFVSGVLTAVIGHNTISYRLFNLLLNTVNGILLFFLILQLFFREEKRHLIALFGALFFLAYPLNDYAVIWHTDLFDRLMTMFYILSLFFFLRDSKWLSILFFLLAALSKEMAFSLPFVIIILSYIKERKVSQSFRDSLPYFILLILLLLFRWLVFDNNIFNLQDAHAGGTIRDVLKNMILFWGMLIFPFFPREIQNMLSENPLLLLSSAFFAAILITFFFIKYSRKDFIIILLIAMVTVILLPASRLLMRWYLYLPSAVFVVLLAYTIFTSSIRIKTALTGAIVLFGLFYSYTIYRQTEWIKVSKEGKSAVENLIKDHKEVIQDSDTINFLTVPAKVNDIPLFQLGFYQHLNHYLNDQKQIEVITRSFLGKTGDKIEINSTPDTISLSHTGANYFILSGNEKNIKFSDEDFNKEKLQRIHYLRDKEPDRIIFTFSEGMFQLIKE